MEERHITYKEFYNKERGLPEPLWGNPLRGIVCPWCGGEKMFASAHLDNPEEIIGVETVRCGYCGHITDYYEAYKAKNK